MNDTKELEIIILKRVIFYPLCDYPYDHRRKINGIVFNELINVARFLEHGEYALINMYIRPNMYNHSSKRSFKPSVLDKHKCTRASRIGLIALYGQIAYRRLIV